MNVLVFDVVDCVVVSADLILVCTVLVTNIKSK